MTGTSYNTLDQNQCFRITMNENKKLISGYYLCTVPGTRKCCDSRCTSPTCTREKEQIDIDLSSLLFLGPLSSSPAAPQRSLAVKLTAHMKAPPVFLNHAYASPELPCPSPGPTFPNRNLASGFVYLQRTSE